MRILLIVDPENPVPPCHYGGTERVADLLAHEWSRRGCIVDVMAGPGSRHYSGRLHLHRAPGADYPSRVRRKVQFQLQSLWFSAVFKLSTHCSIVTLHQAHHVNRPEARSQHCQLCHLFCVVLDQPQPTHFLYVSY